MQLALWEQEPQHCLIEVHYQDGRRRILDTANPEDAVAFRDMSIRYAGFVAVENNITPRCTKGNDSLSRGTTACAPTASIVDNEAVESIA